MVDFDVPEDWYKTFFTPTANRFWELMVSDETERELKFLRRFLPPPPAAILDIPCGAGRHSLALAKEGYCVTGVDISADAIERARLAVVGGCHFEIADMRKFDLHGEFDAIMSLGNSIAYLSPVELEEFIEKLARRLRPSGTLILETYCCAESIFPLKSGRNADFVGGSYSSEVSYEASRSLLKTRAELELDGEEHELLYAHYIITSGELVRMVEKSRLRIDGLFGADSGPPYEPGSRVLRLVGKRAEPRCSAMVVAKKRR